MINIRKIVKDWCYKHLYLKREPDLFVGGREKPYLLRWYVIPRNPFFNVYFHIFKRSDHAEALHDHPWLFNASFVLDGSYTEVMFDKSVDRRNRVAFYQRAIPARMKTFGDDPIEVPAQPEIKVLRPLPNTVTARREEGDFHFRWGKAPHRVQLHRGPVRPFGHVREPDGTLTMEELPCSTLFITGPKIRKWGFYCPKGWKHWKSFLGKYENSHESIETNGCD